MVSYFIWEGQSWRLCNHFVMTTNFGKEITKCQWWEIIQRLVTTNMSCRSVMHVWRKNKRLTCLSFSDWNYAQNKILFSHCSCFYLKSIAFYNFCILTMSNQHVSHTVIGYFFGNHNITVTTHERHRRPFVRGLQRQPVIPLTKVMQKVLSCHDIIMLTPSALTFYWYHIGHLWVTHIQFGRLTKPANGNWHGGSKDEGNAGVTALPEVTYLTFHHLQNRDVATVQGEALKRNK